MRSLFLKIFLWFWLAMVLVSLTLMLSSLVHESHSSQRRDEEMDRTMTPLMADRITTIYDRDGAVAFATFLSHSQSFPWRPFLFDFRGREVLGRTVPPEGMAAFRLALDQPEVQIVRGDKARWVGKSVVTDAGHKYVLVLEVTPPPHPPPSFLSAPSLVQLLRLAAIILIVGLISLWLTRHITSPIFQLRRLANQLASGNLSARVGEISPRRNDELADLSRDFDHMADQIETLIAAQQRLLSDISHELRSPLARLSVALGIAYRTTTPESVPALQRIERETERLNQLIGGLLNLARLESDGSLLTKDNIQLELLLREIIDDANFEAVSRNRSVQLVSSCPCVVKGNADLLRSAIENVIRNGVNYTAEGTAVEVSLSAANGHNALLRVRDHGPGVPEDTLASLFLPFYRVQEARDRNSGGIGLGLSITERALRAHGGTVVARNAPDGGLLVEICLPVAAASSSAAVSAGSIESP